MIEEAGLVVEIDSGGNAWVETERRSVCAGCRLKTGCGSGVLSQWLSRRPIRVLASNPVAASKGERVVLALQEGALVRGSLVLYIVPLLAMFVAAVLGESLSNSLNVQGESLILGFAAVGLVIAFAWVGHFSRRASGDLRYQPVIIERLVPPVDDQVSAAVTAGEGR